MPFSGIMRFKKRGESPDLKKLSPEVKIN